MENLKNLFSEMIKNKRIVIGIVIFIVIIIFLAFIFLNKVKIVKAKTENLELVNYEHENFTMKIPKGWAVETSGEDMYFSIRIYDPNDNRYQIFSILKVEPLLKNYDAKKWYENYYKAFGGNGNKLLAKAIVLENPTIEDFYSKFNDYVNFTKEIGSTFNAPDLKNFTTIESFENNSQLKSISTDDKILRGTFEDSKTGKIGEGLFMGTLINPGTYNATGYDMLFYTIYNVNGISTGEYDLVNYQEILTNSLNSLVYKDSFINETTNNINQTTNNILAINKSINDAFNSYNSAWNTRQKTYDISSQKYSDATLGYERVYDTKTGDIYKAYNGFTDDYTGSRYKSVTNDMYTSSISGYIEK